MKLQKNYTTKIRRDILFDAWVSPDSVIEPITKIESNPVEGGIYKLYSESPSGTAVMLGEFKEVVPNEKLEYTWHWEGSDEKTLIRVEFKEREGETHVAIEHNGFLTEESKEMHDTGWDSYLKGLESKILNA